MRSALQHATDTGRLCLLIASIVLVWAAGPAPTRATEAGGASGGASEAGGSSGGASPTGHQRPAGCGCAAVAAGRGSWEPARWARPAS